VAKKRFGFFEWPLSPNNSYYKLVVGRKKAIKFQIVFLRIPDAISIFIFRSLKTEISYIKELGL